MNPFPLFILNPFVRASSSAARALSRSTIASGNCLRVAAAGCLPPLISFLVAVYCFAVVLVLSMLFRSELSFSLGSQDL